MTRPVAWRVGGGAVATAAAAAAAACVHIDAAPGGVASVRIDAAPPSVAIGDSLRDSLGNAYRVRAIAYDAAGSPIPTAAFQYAYIPTVPDTAAGAVADTALVVDATTGAVRASARWQKGTGRVVARLGPSYQVADTVQIVARADSLVPTDTTRTLRFDCTDSTAIVVQGADTAFVNTVGPFTLVVRGDSLGSRVAVRRWLVRWSVDSVPGTPIPTVTLPDSSKVPAIAVIGNTADRVVTYDTTDASGTSNVRLRIRPFALGKTYVADTNFRVTLRADVLTGRRQLVARLSTARPGQGTFAIRLLRQSGLARTANAACRR